MKAGLQRWIGRAPDLSAVISRFPIAVLVMAVFTLIIIFIDKSADLRDPLGRMLVGLCIAGYISVCWTVSREGRGLKPLWPAELIVAVIIATVAWFSKDLMLNIVMAVAGVLLWLGNSVRNRRARDDLHVWDFTHKIWTGAAFATLGSIIFTIGVFAINQALKSLFGINIEELIQDFILPIGLGFLAPVYWLSTVPPANESHEELYDNPGFVSKAVAFLGTWLLSPLTLIYAAILIAYAVKIILQGELPKGEIATLTTPFLIIGALTWLVLEPPFIKDKLPAKLFRKSWFFLSIPAAVMLAIAVWVRIDAYGLTPERIALVFCVIWALGIGAWFTFGPKGRRDIRFIPGMAAGLFVFGALFADRLSFGSQLNRAANNLKLAGIMTDAGTIAAKEDIVIADKDAASRAKGAIRYLARYAPKKTWKKLIGTDAPSNLTGSRYVVNDHPLFERLALVDIADASLRGGMWAHYNNPDNRIDVSGYSTLYGPLSLHRSDYYAESNKKFSQNLLDTDDLKIQADSENIKIEHAEHGEILFGYNAWISGLTLSGTELLVEDPYISLQNDTGLAAKIKITNLGRSEMDTRNSGQNISFFIMVSEP